MLSKAEIERLLKKERPIVVDEAIMKLAEQWDRQWEASPRLIGLVYSYVKHKYREGETLEDIERSLGVISDHVSQALRELEYHGYLMISRATKPFQYRVVK